MIEIRRGNPASDAIPYDDLVAAARYVVRKYPESLNCYLPPEGFIHLREFIAQSYDCNGIEQVILGNGSIELLSSVCDVLSKIEVRSKALVELPSYDMALEIIRAEGVQARGVTMHTDGLDISEVNKRIVDWHPSFLYTIPDFQNPTGISLSLEKRKLLVELAKNHGFWIVEDAAYRELRYLDRDLPTLYELAPDRVLHLGSFSKTVAPGLRVGYLIGHDHIVRAVADNVRLRRLFPNTFNQALIYALLKNGSYQKHLAALKELYFKRLKLMLECLETDMPPMVHWPNVEGGFFVGLFCASQIKSVNFVEVARRNGLELLRGESFFVEPTANQLFVRLAFPQLNRDQIQQVSARLRTSFGQI